MGRHFPLTRQAIDGNPGNYPRRIFGHDGVAHGHHAPKGPGISPQTSLAWLREKTPGNCFQENIRFGLAMTFPGNLPVPVMSLGADKMSNGSLVE